VLLKYKALLKYGWPVLLTVKSSSLTNWVTSKYSTNFCNKSLLLSCKTWSKGLVYAAIESLIEDGSMLKLASTDVGGGICWMAVKYIFSILAANKQR